MTGNQLWKHAHWLAIGALLLAGCDSPGRLYPVHGRVSTIRGALPRGEYRRIFFQPVSADAGAGEAFADIRDDGTYSLTTLSPGDGAYQGKYKVLVFVRRTADGPSLVSEKYAYVDYTPFEVEVGPTRQNRFHFVLE